MDLTLDLRCAANDISFFLDQVDLGWVDVQLGLLSKLLGQYLGLHLV